MMQSPLIRSLHLTLILALLSTHSMAQERLEMQGTSITGNRELPSMLYIVPWKSAQSVDLGELPFSSVLNTAAQPVEPANYQRKVQLFHELYPTLKATRP